MMRERDARMALAALLPMASPAFARALESCGPLDLWNGFLELPDSPWGRKAAAIDVDQLCAATKACGARFVIPGDDEWPTALVDLSTAEVGQQSGEPVGLWIRGTSLSQLVPRVSVVGARAATSYGEGVAITLAADLAAAGHCIVSGLAFGIDAAAHRGALGAGGHTVAIVASGLDCPYPAAHRDLAERVVEAGALVSELPPGSRPMRHAFLARNRLIAAMSQAVVIVEAASRSGAKNTASWANALGRVLLATPGPITSSLTATPHRLIRDGEAILCTGATDVAQVLAPIGELSDDDGRGRARTMDRLTAELACVREAIGPREEVSAAVLTARTGQSMMEVIAHATELTESGWLEETPMGWALPRPRSPRA